MRLTRLFDIIISCGVLFLGSPLLTIIYIACLLDTKRPLFFQHRLGINKKPFTLIKFRTMKLSSKDKLTHLSDPSDITSFGKLLRSSKLDELPQFINVLRGEMSIVGPRPGLVSDTDLIAARDKKNIYEVLPGITGLSQISNIDMSNPILLAKTDQEMLLEFRLNHYFYYILKTFLATRKTDK